MLIVISPAKSLDFETNFNCKIVSKPKFERKAQQIVDEFKKLSPSDLEKLQKISPKLAELNFLRWQNFQKSQTRQALLAFDGDVYAGIEKEKYQEADFEFAQNHLRILSGLYGILKPMDLIAPYRLEMGTDFKKFKFATKNLYHFWGDKIVDELEILPEKEVINLASQEYFEAINLKKLSKRVINIHFKDCKNGVLKTVGINSKKMRGLMTNFVILKKIKESEKLKKFSSENYIFDEKFSDKENWVFIKN